MIVLSAVAALLVLVLGVDVVRVQSSIRRVPFEAPSGGSDRTNYLLVGNDTRSFVRDGADAASFGSPTVVPGDRADLVMVLSVPDDGDPSLLVIPRDLVLETPGRGHHRLALAYSDGAQALADTLCHSLGIGVDHVIALDMAGLRTVVDEVDGVEVDIGRPLRDGQTGLDLPTGGRQRLDGRQALQLVRSRQLEELVDGRWRRVTDEAAARAEHGRAVFEALGLAIDARSANPFSLRQLATVLAPHLVVDDGLGWREAQQVRAAAAWLGGHPEAAATVPVVMTGASEIESMLDRSAGNVLRDHGAGDRSTCVPPPSVPDSAVPAPLPSASTGGSVPG